MKKYLLLLLLSATLFGQAPQPTGIRTGYITPYPSGSFTGVANRIGFGTTTPAAAFDFSSTTGGLLPPRVTTTQMNAIVLPVNFSWVANVTTGTYWHYYGGVWVNDGITPTFQSIYDAGSRTITDGSSTLSFDPSAVGIYDGSITTGFGLGGYSIDRNDASEGYKINDSGIFEAEYYNTANGFSGTFHDGYARPNSNDDPIYMVPWKSDNATHTYAFLDDIPSVSGFVPYTGATTNLNLGSHTITANNFSGTSSGTNTGDNATNSTSQPLDSDLTAIAALSTDAFGRGLLIQTSAANVRTYIGAGTGSGSVTGVTSANSDIAVSAASPNPQLTLNSGTGANQIVKRDGSGNLNATTATTLATPRTIGTATGDVTSTGSAFDGSSNNTNAYTLASVGTAGTYGSASNVPVTTYDAKGRETAVTNTPIQIAESQVTNLVTDLAAKATDANVVHTTGAETIAGVKTFSSTIAGSVNGNAATATALQTARNINGVPFDGTANITVTATATVAPDFTTGSSTIAPSVDAVNTENQKWQVKNAQNDFRGKTIYFFGDSYIAGTGATTTAFRWSTVICKGLGAVENNNGYAGTTLEKRALINYAGSPNMVDNVTAIPTYTVGTTAELIFAYGLNDVGYTVGSYTTANFATDYATVIANAVSKGWPTNKILLVSPYWVSDAGLLTYNSVSGNTAPTRARLLSFVQATQDVAIANKCLYINMYDAILNNNTSNMAADGLHPNNEGHSYIANTIGKFLTPNYSRYGSWAQTSVTSPTTVLDLGGEFGSTAGNFATQKIKLFSTATVTGDYGFAVNSAAIDYEVGTGGAHRFWTATTKILDLNTTLSVCSTRFGVQPASALTDAPQYGQLIKRSYVGKTAAYTLTTTDYTVEATTGTFDFTLPTAVGVSGQHYEIKNSGTGITGVVGTSSQTFDGLTRISVMPGSTLIIYSDNANWKISSYDKRFFVNATTTPFTTATLNSTYPDVPTGFTIYAPSVGTGMQYTKLTEAGTSDIWNSSATTAP